jgi:hypothetical protein
MITNLHTCAVDNELDVHNIVVILEPTQQRVYTRELDIILCSGILARTRHI